MGACFFGLRQETARTETVGATDRGSRYDILDEYSVDEMIRIDNEAWGETPHTPPNSRRAHGRWAVPDVGEMNERQRREQELERMDVIFSGDFLDHSIRSNPIPIR
jgi:hypothetical protein